jgi:uncharacterized protein (TIGR03437 family)
LTGKGKSMNNDNFFRSVRQATIVCGIFAFTAAAQTGFNGFDSSANATLKGAYFLRQVLIANFDQNNGAITHAISLTGTLTFDGNGNYTFSGQETDSTTGSTAQAFTATGQYSVAANGLAQIQGLYDNTDIEFGAVSGIGPSAIVASATEGLYDDVFIAIPIASSVSNSSLQGTYKVGFIDFLQANASQVRDGYYTLISTGNGSLGNVTISGAMANQNSNATTQTVSGVTYSLAASGGSITFPTASNPLTALVSGQKSFNISADGNILLGGAPNGFDLIVGVKGLSGPASNSTFQGTYYSAALENDASDLANGNNNVDSFYGSVLALGEGDLIYHERLTFFDAAAGDFTGDYQYQFGSDGTYNDGGLENILGAGGQALLQVGVSTFYSLTANFMAQNYTGGKVFIDPLRIWNAANFAPVTNPVAPGEYVTIFGTGLSTSTASAQSFPLPTNMGGAQVAINGRLAPLSYVSPTQINLLVPYATSEDSAVFQVTTNNVTSNQVTMYTNLTAPGVFALTSNGGAFAPGVGPAAVLHANYTLVTPSSPAVAGETLQLYLTGLGSVTPAVNDGAAAPSSSLSTVDETIVIYIADANGNFVQANVSFQGLAPGFAGLYQVNFVVPSGLASGLAEINVGTDEAVAQQAKLYVQ